MQEHTPVLFLKEGPGHELPGFLLAELGKFGELSLCFSQLQAVLFDVSKSVGIKQEQVS